MKKILGAVAVLGLPFVAFAQGNTGNNFNFNVFTSSISQIGNIITMLLPITVAAALLFFFYGLAKFVLAAGDDDAREEGKKVMIWGVVALFVMVSVWGLVEFLGSILNIRQGQSINNVPGVGGIR